MSHPTKRLDPTIHQPTRLGIVTAAREARRIDFVSLRELLDVTDGNLSRHLSTLESAGYITIEKTFEGRRPRRGITATTAGRKALTAEIAALREIVGAAEQRPRRGARAAADPALLTVRMAKFERRSPSASSFSSELSSRRS